MAAQNFIFRSDGVEILYKSKNAVVIYKPSGIPSQSDLSGDSDAQKITSELLREMGEESNLYLVHRLDRVVAGLMIFARNKKSAAILSDIIAAGEGIGKEYIAVCEGKISFSSMEDYLTKDSRQNKALVVDKERKGAKLASAECTLLSEKATDRGVRSLVKISLKTGRFHQIRAQLSSRGAAIVGDAKYGSRDKSSRSVALSSAAISLDLGAEKISVKALPDLSVYPWNLFSAEEYNM